MKSNDEIRKEAWGVVRSKWFWRIFASGSLLYFVIIVVSLLLNSAYQDMNIQTWQDFIQAKAQAMQAGLGYSVPSAHVFWQMTGASAFQQFIGCVFGSIMVFGMAGLMLKAVRNDESEWFRGSFGGFRRPLELTWLMILMNLRVLLWSLLFVIPGIVAIYRYRQAWYLKSENPDWSAWKCLAESVALMRGRKMQAFGLDVFFLFCWLLPAAVVMFIASAGLACSKGASPILGMITSLGSLVGINFFAFALAYFILSRTVFYREVANRG